MRALIIALVLIFGLAPAQGATLAEDIKCVAGLLGLPVPSRPVVIKHTSFDDLQKKITRKARLGLKIYGGYNKAASVIFLALPDDQEPGAWVSPLWVRGHELAHYILAENGEPYKHDGNVFTEAKINDAARRFRHWCR